MKTYIASIRHSSLADAPQVVVTGTLTAAKAAATRRFGAGFHDHEITIHERIDMGLWFDHALVSSRVIGERRWHDFA